MTDFNYMDPPIDVVATSPRLEMIVARLRASGMRPSISNADVIEPSAVPLLIDFESMPPSVLSQLVRLKAAEVPRTIITLGDGTCPVEPLFRIRSDIELASLPNRLSGHNRRKLRDEEVRLRAMSAEDLGEELPSPMRAPNPDILYLGDGSAFFLALQAALRAKDINLTAALSYATACDNLEKHRFSAVLIDLSESSAQGVQLLERADSDARIAGLPVYVCVREEELLCERAKAAIANATEVITPGVTPSDTADRVTLLAHSRASARPVEPKSRLASAMGDLATGLFSRKFFDVHLPRQMQSTDLREAPLTLLTLRLRSNDDDHSARGALPGLADILKPLIRETDCAARLDSTTIAISMPDSPYAGAVRMAEKIIAALGGDQLGMVGSPLPFGGTLGWRAVERRQYHDPDKLITSATNGPYARIRAA